MTSLKDNRRLSEVLELFLLPNYNIVSTTYLDLLLSHISENIKESSTNDYAHCEFFQKWIMKALNIWHNECTPSQPISIFTLKLVGIVSRNELQFHYWQFQDVYNKMCDIFKLHSPDLPVSIKMAYTTLLCNLINHRSGRQWIIDSGIWKDVLKYAQLNHTLYVTRESHKFLWLLLLHEHQNTGVCKEIISVIAEPLTTNNFESQVCQALGDNYLDQNKLLCTTLDLLTNIIENTLFENLENTIPELCEEVINLEMRVKALFEACISTKLLPQIHKLLLLCLFIPLKQLCRERKKLADADVSLKFCCDLNYISLMLLSKKYVGEVVKMNKLLMIYWKKLQALHEINLNQQHKFELQAITIMILPLFSCIRHSYIDHDFFDMFITKMFDVTCTAVQRLAYNIRDTIVKNDLPIVQIAKVTVDMLLEITEIMDRDIAVITFQTLCYVLKNCVPDTCNEVLNNTSNTANNSDCGSRKAAYKYPLDGDPIVEHPGLLLSILNGLAVMTEKFKLKWQECVETICLLSLAQEILNHPGIVPMICVKALKVCKLAIQNFMPPNLVLLIETDSHMNEIGPTLFRRLHDINWEVRDSVLEVLNTIATISEDKYPAFQEFLLANDFLQLAIEIAKTDAESYVRASALIFISSTVRINKLWDAKLSQFDLPNIAIDLFNNESEAIVRKEAVILIKELYVHRKWPKNIIDLMSRGMATAAVFDLHWEVKISALEYWKQFIKSHLSDQGVLDGHFPKVTFSKEHRKIVSLNESEIKRRLNKALDEMAKQNCLGVLLVTLEDDSDFEVCKTSAAIIMKLKTFLLKYKLNEPLPILPLPKDSATLDTSYVKYESADSVESSNCQVINKSSNVIEEIVDADDANLLASIYKNSMKMDSGVQKSEEKTFQCISCVTRQAFLQTILNSDINAYIEERSRWLTTYTTSFESVLDDILTMYKQGNMNSMDCY
ncbi:integrator complex assembly factor Brat1 [Xylocopa sonorina]|uniref:integrator complex assembly factor Brat1 n=1 Tax=Xylocopa sonorina TaxID=1818115 RepID=UPI00403AF672